MPEPALIFPVPMLYSVRMFFSKPPTLDVNEEKRLWLEQQILRLVEVFGAERALKSRVVLPLPEYFPEHYGFDEEGLAKLIAKVCGYMGVDSSLVDCHIYSEDEHSQLGKHFTSWSASHSGSAGKYYGRVGETGRYMIGVEKSKLRNALSLIATIAHELGHVLLLGEGRISRDDKDHEILTDLTTIYLGMGVFLANSAFQFRQWNDSAKQGWSISQQGYLGQSMSGYALAAWTWMRGDIKAPWSHHLAPNVKDMFKRSLKYLNRGGETSLAPFAGGSQAG